MNQIFKFLLLLLFSSNLYSQELYKYTDENGIEHIVDSPYKLPEKIRDKYIKEYKKNKKEALPVDLQDTRPAYNNVSKTGSNREGIYNQEQELKEKKKANAEREKRLQRLTIEMEETIKELGYKRQRALITQVPELKSEVEKLKKKIEDIKQEIEKLKEEEQNNK